MADKPANPPTDDRRDNPENARARAIRNPANPLWEPPRDDPRRDVPAPSRGGGPDGSRRGKPQ